MLINCSRGCGVPIEISMEQIKEAQELGVPLNVAHSTCPNEPGGPAPRVYEFTVTVTRHDDGDDAEKTKVVVAEVAGSTSAPTFLLAFPALTETLSKRWEEVQRFAPIADQDATSPAERGEVPDGEGPE